MNLNTPSSEFPEMIDLFLDGELGSIETDVLFHALAGNSELQHSFQQSVRLLRASVADASAVSVPPANITEIFGKAGLSLPNVLPLATAPTFMSKVTPLLFTAGISSILTLLLTLIFMGDSYHDERQIRTASASNSSRLPITPSAHSDSPVFTVLTTVDTDSPLKKSHSTNRLATKSVTDNSATSSTMDNSTISSTIEEIDTQEETSSISTPVSTIAALRDVYDFSPPASVLNEIIPPEAPEYHEDLGLVVQVRGLGGIGVGTEASIVPRSGSNSSNIGIAGYFRLNEHEMIGIELGQEELPDLQISTSATGRFSSMTFATAAYRFSLKPFSETGKLKPYGQLALGGSQLGALGKITLGCEWKPVSMIGLLAGMECSALTYRHNNQIQLAKKAGLFAGISLGF